ncbi:MAG: TRAP transporter substrate-binding protein DctP [Spirochaetia bacterium]|jgi:TRAP-type C4-dicarboxylate transport system substrate-binding protein|nr:TRAP transporter substrate-binding protein DctP [Spirochaetia bacterium]
MKKIFIFLFILLSAAVFAQEIKIGTVAPAGSAWETTIKEIASEWTRISGGEISVKIYSGGTVGDEEDIIRKIKLGRLNAAALTSQGIKSISNDLFALSIPMLVKDDDEFNYVFEKIEPLFNKKMEENGFVPLGWAMTGWVKWFTKSEVVYPDDLMQIKLAVDNSDDKVIKIWQSIGFKVIPLSLSDLMSGIYSGMADGTYITPYAANAMGIAEYTPYMLDLQIAPVYGVLTISDRTWKKVNDSYKPLLLKRTGEILNQFYGKITVIENEGLKIMKQKGLVSVPITPDAAKEWDKIVEDGVGLFVKESISPSLYSEIKKYINEYRKK